MYKTVVSEVIPKVNKAYPNQFQFVFCHQVQPWHPSSTLVHEAAIAVSQLAPERFWDFSTALFDKCEEYYDEPCWAETRRETYERLAQLAHDSASVDKQQFLKYLSIDPNPASGSKNAGNKASNDLKVFIKYARQNGVHVSPTVAINGVIDNSFDSSTTCDKWIEKLKSL